MTKPTKKLIGLALVSSLALSACSPDIGKQSARGDVSAHIDAVNAQIDEDGSRLQKLTATGRPANIRVRDGLYLGRDGFRTGRGDPLPRRFESDAGVSMNLAEPMELRDFALELRRITGLRIDYRDLANTPPLRGTILEDDQGSSQGSGADSTGMGMVMPASASNNEGGNVDHPLSIDFRVNYTGPLSGLLDQVAAQVGADWEYKGGRIKFLGAQTVTYTVWALPGTIKSDSTIGGGGSSSVFGGSSPASTSRSVEMDYWEEIEAGLGAIIPSDGSVYSLNKTTGTIVLTSYQNIHERVAEFVERENARLSRQVAVKVDLLAFSESKSDNRSTNLQLALNDVADGIGGTFTTSPNNIDDAIGIGTTILGTSDSSSGGVDTNLSGWKDDMAGSKAIINALSKKGKVALLNSVSVMAMNNAPTPVSIMKEKAYLAGTTTEIADDGEETTELETGVINNGINIVMTPRIMRSGDVNIDYTLNLSQLIGMDSFESQGMMIQLPEVETRNFMQSVNLASGDTMVIAAYDSRRTERAGSGPFDPRFWGLGGQDGFSTDTTKILVLMTPVVVEKQNAPRIRN